MASRGGGDQRPRSAGSDCRGTVDGRRGAFNSMSRARAMLLPRGATAERRGMATRDRPRPALRDAPVWEGPPGPSWAGIRHSSLAPPRILPAAVALPRGEFSCRARRTSTESHVEVQRPDRSSSGNSPPPTPSPPGPADGPARQARQALHRPAAPRRTYLGSNGKSRPGEFGCSVPERHGCRSTIGNIRARGIGRLRLSAFLHGGHASSVVGRRSSVVGRATRATHVLSTKASLLCKLQQCAQ